MTPSDNCVACEEQLGAYVVGLLDPESAEWVRRHSDTCERCALALRETRALAGVVRAVPVPGPAVAFDDSLAAVLSRVTEHESTAAAFAPVSPREATMDARGVSAQPAREAVISRHKARQRRLRSLGALAAALALIVAATAIFSSFTGHRRVAGPAVASPTATETSTPSPQPAWKTVAHLSSMGGQIMVARSDPRVLYRLQPGMKLSRSGDEGQTWSARTIPMDRVGPTGRASIDVDPSNQNTLYLSLTPGPDGPSCPQLSIGAKVARSGNPLCVFQYVSTDGGASWKQPVLPEPGALGIGGLGAVVAQGKTRYARLDVGSVGFPIGVRLVSSVDGGVTWTFADGQVAAQGDTVWEFIATPTGSSLFAEGVPTWSVANGKLDLIHTDLWRSEDAGRTWSDLGQFPDITTPSASQNHLMAATIQGGRTIVYRYTSEENTTVVGAQAVYVSTDAGKSWQAVPFDGVPQIAGMFLPPAAPFVLGQPADGSLMLPFANWDGSQTDQMSLAYYEWRPGAASWTRLTPDVTLYYSQPGWLTSAQNGQPEAIWLRVFAGFTQSTPGVEQGTGEDLLRFSLG